MTWLVCDPLTPSPENFRSCACGVCNYVSDGVRWLDNRGTDYGRGSRRVHSPWDCTGRLDDYGPTWRYATPLETEALDNLLIRSIELPSLEQAQRAINNAMSSAQINAQQAPRLRDRTRFMAAWTRGSGIHWMMDESTFIREYKPKRCDRPSRKMRDIEAKPLP